MSGDKRYEQHSKLVDEMAEVLGVDLIEEAMAGRWTPEDMKGMVTRCLGCTDPQSCKGWLDQNKAGTDETPGYCRNKALLEAMRTRLASA